MTVTNDDILELLDSALSADYTRVRRAGSRIAQQLSTEDPKVAKEIRAILRRRGVPLKASGYSETLPLDPKSKLPLIEEVAWPISPVFLNRESNSTYTNFLEDVQNAQKLIDGGLSARLSMLISGPPGTGKTLLAGHIAARLGRPIYVVRLDAVVSSLLGDTSKNLRQVFEFVPSRQSVLFLDEMDAVAKMRDDRHELGELKRVVNTVIQALDSLDDHAVVLGATNHPQLLDPAIWRRFPYKIELGLPDQELRAELWRFFLDESVDAVVLSLAVLSSGLSGADIRNLALSARRQAVLDGRPVDAAAVAWAAYRTQHGAQVLPDRSGATSEQKRTLARVLVREEKVTGAEAAKALGVSRQSIFNYLKED